MQQLTLNSLLNGGTYKIEQVLGQGSFGITYLATHTALNKKVAIKEFFMKELNGRGEDGSITGMSDGSLSMDYARKFQKEALNLSHLEHPNIVRVTDSFADNGTYYYVMDYIEGENLNDYVKTHHVSQQEAVDIIRDVAQALMYMHEEKHMLHLDLKPGNIMRRASDGHIFLIDFGLSKHYSSDGQPETSTTIGLGTAGYAPIEQANRAKNGEFRPTIDVYALGATFYKLLTRETPPAASELVSDDELLTNNLREKGASQQLTNIIIQAMLPNVNRRTPSVRAFLSSLPFGSSAVNDSDDYYQQVCASDKEETVVGDQTSEEESVYEHPAQEEIIKSAYVSDEEKAILNHHPTQEEANMGKTPRRLCTPKDNNPAKRTFSIGFLMNIVKGIGALIIGGGVLLAKCTKNVSEEWPEIAMVTKRLNETFKNDSVTTRHEAEYLLKALGQCEDSLEIDSSVVFTHESASTQDITEITPQKRWVLERKIIGKYYLNIQWIDWDSPGYVSIERSSGGRLKCKGSQKSKLKNYYMTIDGYVTPDSEGNLLFDGEIITYAPGVYEANNGYRIRKGKYNFEIVCGSIGYWRIKQRQLNDGSYACDYIDIYKTTPYQEAKRRTNNNK